MATTYRLPAPPLPPKPLHLTVSRENMRDDRRGGYPRMPSWSRDGSPERNGDGAAVLGGKQIGEDESVVDEFKEAKNGLDQLDVLGDGAGGALGGLDFDLTKYKKRKSRRMASGASSRGGSTIRKDGGKKGGGERTSIYFAAHQPNPLVAPSPSTTASTSPSSLDVPTVDSDADDVDDNLLEIPIPVQAISLHSFAGEAAFGELSFDAGVEIMIEVEDLGGGWSLGYENRLGEGARGLIPRGWYAYVAEPTKEDGDEVEGVGDLSIEIRPPRPTTPFPALLSTESSENPMDPIDISNPTKPPPPSSSPTPSLLRSSTPLPALPSNSPPYSHQTSTLDTSDDNLSDAPSPTSSPHLLETSSLTPSRPLSLDEYPNSSPTSPKQLVSSPGGRSIGRSVIISGIEFEPFIPTSNPDSTSPVMNVPLAPAWLLRTEEEDMGRGSVKLTGQEMRDFFGSTRSIKVAPVERRVDLGSMKKSGGVEAGERRLDDEDEIVEEVEAVESSPRIESSIIELAGDAADESLSVRDVDMAELEGDVVHTTPIVDAAIEVPESSPPPTDVMADTADELSVIEYPVEVEGLTTVAEEEDLPDHISTTPSPPAPPSDPLDRIRPPTTPVRLKSILGRLSTIGRSYSVSAVGLGYGSIGRSTVLSMGGDEKSTRLSVRDWILRGEETRLGGSVFHIDSSLAWRHDSPPFNVRVHSPEKQSETVGGPQYTSFQVSTTFSHSPPFSDETDAPTTATVDRRYSHFVLLHSLLLSRYPLLSIPSLPPPSYVGRLGDQFVEARRRELERWCRRVGRHAVLRSSEEVRSFLVLENERELGNLLRRTEREDRSFFASVFHPEFNIDFEDAEENAARFERHAKALEGGRGIQQVEICVKRVREGLRDHAINMRQMAHALARHVAGLALPPVSSEEGFEQVDDETPLERDRRRARLVHLQNEDGALTWKEGCDESLSVTKAVQATAEAIDAIAGLYDEDARSTLLPVQELCRELAYPYSQHTSLLETHRSILAQHKELASSSPSTEAHEEAVARCDTILNITSAELERVHSERNEDLKSVAEQYLEGQIQLHEQALTHLHFAMFHLEPTAFASLAHTGPRLHSTLESPPAPLPPLPAPSNFKTPSSALEVASAITRPVGDALSEGVGSVLGRRPKASAIAVHARESSGGKGELSASELMGLRGGDGRETWRQTLFGTRSLW